MQTVLTAIVYVPVSGSANLLNLNLLLTIPSASQPPLSHLPLKWDDVNGRAL